MLHKYFIIHEPNSSASPYYDFSFVVFMVLWSLPFENLQLSGNKDIFIVAGSFYSVHSGIHREEG